jgi:hypothetical protein
MFERFRFLLLTAASSSFFFLQLCLGLRAQLPSYIQDPQWVGRDGSYQSVYDACESYDVNQQYYVEPQGRPNSSTARCSFQTFTSAGIAGGFVEAGSIEIQQTCPSGYQLVRSDVAGGCFSISWLNGRNLIISGSKQEIMTTEKSDVIIVLPAEILPYYIYDWEPGDLIILWTTAPFKTLSPSVNNIPSTLILIDGVHSVTVFDGTRDVVGPYIVRGSDIPQ